jgi:hypothetical protein
MNPVLCSNLEPYGDNFAFNITQCFGRSVMENNNLSRPIYLKFIVVTVINTDTGIPEHSQPASKGLKSSHSVMQICSNSVYMLI